MIQILDLDLKLGENPLWHPEEAVFYLTDIDGGLLYRLDPRTLAAEVCYQGPKVGGFTLQEDGALLLFRDRGNVALWRDGEVVETVIEEIDEVVSMEGRFNDVIAAPDGSVLCGTASESGEGKLYHLDLQGGLSTLLEDAGISNGIGFLDENQRLLHTNSRDQVIHSYRYGSSLEDKLLWLDLSDGPGTPDGLTIDSEGRIWSARYDGGAVYVYDPEGLELDRLKLPVPKTTSLIFGGPDLDLLLVTSADGPAFLLREAGRGRPEYRSCIATQGEK